MTLFPESKTSIFEMLEQFQDEIWSELKRENFILEPKKMTEPKTDKIDLKLQKWFKFMKMLNRFELNGAELKRLEKVFENFELVDLVLENRAKITEIIVQTFEIRSKTEIRQNDEFRKMVKILIKLNQICPPSIWEEDRFVLVASILNLMPSTTETGKLGCFLNGPSPASFEFIFGLFQTNIKICEKCPSSIRCPDLNPQPSDCESHPIIT